MKKQLLAMLLCGYIFLPLRTVGQVINAAPNPSPNISYQILQNNQTAFSRPVIIE